MNAGCSLPDAGGPRLLTLHSPPICPERLEMCEFIVIGTHALLYLHPSLAYRGINLGIVDATSPAADEYYKHHSGERASSFYHEVMRRLRLIGLTTRKTVFIEFCPVEYIPSRMETTLKEQALVFMTTVANLQAYFSGLLVVILPPPIYTREMEISAYRHAKIKTDTFNKIAVAAALYHGVPVYPVFATTMMCPRRADLWMRSTEWRNEVLYTSRGESTRELKRRIACKLKRVATDLCKLHMTPNNSRNE